MKLILKSQCAFLLITNCGYRAFGRMQNHGQRMDAAGYSFASAYHQQYDTGGSSSRQAGHGHQSEFNASMFSNGFMFQHPYYHTSTIPPRLVNFLEASTASEFLDLMSFKGSPLRNKIYGAECFARSKIRKLKLSSSNLVICNPFAILAGLALTSNRGPLFRVHHAP